MQNNTSLLGRLKFKITIVLPILFFGVVTCYLLLVTFVRAQCQSNDRNQGLISTTKGLVGDTLFGNIEQVCIVGTQSNPQLEASYREFKLSDDPYQALEDQFYTKSRVPANIKKAPNTLSGNTWNFTGAGNGIYLQTSSVTLDSGIPTSSSITPTATTVPPSGTQVIFVKGNLDIKSNIDYAGGPPPDPNSGLVFIVSGNINIAPEVTKINAVLISSGFICTATSDFTNSTCYNGQADWQQLIINGSLISINTENLPEPAIKLGRNLELNTQPAEKVNKQPKYLYNLRNGLFTRDLIITSEDQLYPITAVGVPSPSPSSAPPPGAVICSPVPNSISGDDQKIPGCICLSGNPTCSGT